MKDGRRAWLELKKMLAFIEKLPVCPDCGEEQSKKWGVAHKWGCEVAMATRFSLEAKWAKQ